MALVILSLAAATLLLTVDSSIDTAQHSLEELQARGIARQLLDEVCSLPYKEKGGSWDQYPLGPEPGEGARFQFDDVDDYASYTATPPQGPWAVQLGMENGFGGQRHPAFRVTDPKIGQMRAQVAVQYVDESDHSKVAGAPTGCRRVQVLVELRVDGQWVELARAERIVSYVPGSAS